MKPNTISSGQWVAAIQTAVSRVGAYISSRMANQILKAISGIATVNSAPRFSIRNGPKESTSNARHGTPTGMGEGAAVRRTGSGEGNHGWRGKKTVGVGPHRGNSRCRYHH